MKEYDVYMRTLKALALLLACWPCAAQADEKCLDYEPAQVTITGILEEREYIPPPKISGLENPAAIWIVRLPKPACVRGVPNHPHNRDENNITEIQLTIVTPLDGLMYPEYRKLRGKELEVTGALYHSQPAWDTGTAVRIKGYFRQTKEDPTELANLPKGCLSYEPAMVFIDGVIRAETFPGPPEFEDIRKGDRPMTYWILHPDKPRCVKGDFNSGINDQSELNVQRMQLVMGNSKGTRYDDYRHLVSKKVRVTGRLYHAHTGWHVTDVLLEVERIQAR